MIPADSTTVAVADAIAAEGLIRYSPSALVLADSVTVPGVVAKSVNVTVGARPQIQSAQIDGHKAGIQTPVSLTARRRNVDQSTADRGVEHGVRLADGPALVTVAVNVRSRPVSTTCGVTVSESSRLAAGARGTTTETWLLESEGSYSLPATLGESTTEPVEVDGWSQIVTVAIAPNLWDRAQPSEFSPCTTGAIRGLTTPKRTRSWRARPHSSSHRSHPKDRCPRS